LIVVTSFKDQNNQGSMDAELLKTQLENFIRTGIIPSPLKEIAHAKVVAFRMAYCLQTETHKSLNSNKTHDLTQILSTIRDLEEKLSFETSETLLDFSSKPYSVLPEWRACYGENLRLPLSFSAASLSPVPQQINSATHNHTEPCNECSTNHLKPIRESLERLLQSMLSPHPSQMQQRQELTHLGSLLRNDIVEFAKPGLKKF
jgi:hypothetical protein